ncbi:MAG: helix-turn-helix domain-containing protein [Peptococcaceae bacterium]|jgi:predicted transcriptional regulator YheO|nr:helix-turn-helix domain-containing protein [Peptococcaceae bacterium]
MPHHELEQYTRLVQMLGTQFGDSCDAILYSLEGIEQRQGTAVAVRGTTAGAKPGTPLPAFLLEHIQNQGFKDIYGFINKSLSGLVLRTSVQFLFSSDQRPIGCLCIHHNIVHIKMITSFLEELTRPSNLEDEDEQEENRAAGEKFYSASDIQGFLNSIISEFIVERVGDANFSSLEKSDKLALIAELDQRGVFLVKGAVNMIARRINVSKFSIYNYLDEIRTDGYGGGGYKD